jgi:hypothetical protein
MNRNVKKCLALLTIREMQIETSVIHVGMAITKKMRYEGMAQWKSTE